MDSVTKPQVDPITVEVISSAIASIVDEMGEALIRASYSTNVKERRDCSTAMFDLHGNTLCQAEHIPIHLGSFIEIIPTIMSRHPVEDMQPGDVFIGNDAYAGGGTHLPDIVLAEPVFVDGKLTAWAVNLAHHADFVDRGHAHIYQEGLRIPTIRLVKAGVLQQDVEDLILLNCQVPHERRSDFRAQMAANRLAVNRMVALCTKYGRDTVLAACDALQDYAERRMRAAISEIPDGSYSYADYFDNPELDEPIKITGTVRVAGDEMYLDFDAPDQVRASINMTPSTLKATCYYAVKTLVDPTVLPNSGLSRPLHVSGRPGSVVSCTHPAAVEGRIGPGQRVIDVIYGALAQAIPERVTAASNGACTTAHFIGTNDDARNNNTWVYIETIGGGFGARATKDGLDGVHVHLTNTSNLPAEALENEYPLTLLRYELVQDSGGPGRTRGGMSIRRVYRADQECRLRVDISRMQVAPWGLAGGLSGAKGQYRFSDAEVNRENVLLRAGCIVEIMAPGAGGYGSPAERGPEAVARDLREGRISAAIAQSVYGHH